MINQTDLLPPVTPEQRALLAAFGHAIYPLVNQLAIDLDASGMEPHHIGERIGWWLFHYGTRLQLRNTIDEYGFEPDKQSFLDRAGQAFDFCLREIFKEDQTKRKPT